MKAGFILCIALLGCISIEAGAQTGLVIDHRCADVTRIPLSWIQQATGSLRVTYQHTSHGSQLVSGIEAIRSESPNISYTHSNSGYNGAVFLNDYGINGGVDLGSGGDLSWRDATVASLNMPGNNRNVVMWSWCGGVSATDEAGIDAYLNAMAGLEQQYPSVKFVYITGHLDGSGADGNLNRMNERIRAFCIAHGKILFDFADIESYDPDGLVNYMERFATDGCEYDANNDGSPYGDANWAEDWAASHPNHYLSAVARNCNDCAHSHPLNCAMKGSAFWWLMARLAGWNGQPATGMDVVAIPPDPVVAIHPNPAASLLTFDVRNAAAGDITIELHDCLGRMVRSFSHPGLGPGSHTLVHGLDGLPAGYYAWRVSAAGGRAHGAFLHNGR